ncbi:class I SAM-dependent methyltransferase [Planctomicrobium sp. SH661]|uniref:class I SAM-dependent methyltransferase n=1 Tax=Planctomicrobium sp. SH661 TaxID=3448124 RepID=UPI003F5B8BF0
MNRMTVVQDAIDQLGAKTYLEVGVFRGQSFFPIRAAQKFAVDPKFKIRPLDKVLWNIKHLFRYKTHYFEMTSDEFFASLAKNPSFSGVRFDVVFLDGLHTFRQTLQDVMNVLNVLSDDGIIILHDCHPPSPSAAYPAESLDHAASLNLPGWTGEWCGDTWKVISQIRATRPDLTAFVLNCDYGLGVITRSPSKKPLDLSESQISGLTYEDLAKDPEYLIDLKDPGDWKNFVGSLGTNA